MAKNKNKFKNKAQKAALLSGLHRDLHPEGNLKDTSLAALRDLLIGVVGGGIAGAALGKPSLAVGAVITGAGHYYGSQSAAVFGVGMMAANGFQNGNKGVNGTMMDGVKERLMAYKDSFQGKIYLDKILKAKKAVAGMGNVQYFNYPLTEGNMAKLDMKALDRIEQQIANSGQQFANNNAVFGILSGGETDDFNY